LRILVSHPMTGPEFEYNDNNLERQMAKRKPKSQRPTVLQVIPALEIGGAERGTIDVAAALVKAGWRALVVSEGGRMVPDLEAVGAEHIVRPMASKNPFQMAMNVRTLRQIIEHEQVDIIHARSRAPAWSAWSAAAKAGIPFVTTYQSIYSENFPLKRFYNSVMVRGELTIANSEYTARLIKERHGDVVTRTEVVHRGVDLNVFSARNVTKDRREKITKDWQLENSVKTLLLPARLARRKGHGLLIAALAKLNLSDLPRFICIYAGDTKGREHMVQQLKQQSGRHGLPEGLIRYPGHCKDMAAAYQAVDIVLMPSTVPEAFGRVAAEAQAMGKPVIVTDIGAVGETVLARPDVNENEITGWRVAPDNPDALAKAIVKALQLSKKETAGISKRAIEFIRQNYSVDKMTSATLQLYSGLSQIQQKPG